MQALGVLGDAPPHRLQEPLEDGVHLRWAFERDLGFPWHGFYLFRRPADQRRSKWSCLLPALREEEAETTVPEVAAAWGRLSGTGPLTLTDDFPDPGIPEVDLRDGPVRCTLTPGRVARAARVRIGLRESESGACVGWQKEREHERDNPTTERDVRFEVFDDTATSAPRQRIWTQRLRGGGSVTGLDCGFALEVALAAPADAVRLHLVHFAEPATVDALDASGAVVDRARMSNGAGEPEWLVLRGDIQTIRIDAPADETILIELCRGEEEAEEGPDGRLRRHRRGITVTASWRGEAMVSDVAAGAAGDVVEVVLAADAIDAVEVGSGDAALVDLCVQLIGADAHRRWRPLPGVRHPIALPVRHPDYPCRPAPVDVADAENEALARVRYGDPDDWAGTPFAELHDEALELVVGGPGSMPMAQRATTGVAAVLDPPDPSGVPPALRRRRPLDMLLLAALHRPLAEIVGLSWTDETAVPGDRYDYLVVADRHGHGGKAAAVLKEIGANGFANLDAWICFDRAAEAAPPLPAPQGGQGYALPGLTLRAQGGDLEDATGNVGLRWALAPPGGILTPQRPLMYHVWRADRGDATTPAADPAFEPVTRKRPIMPVPPAAGPAPGRPPDWPPFALHWIDRGLPEGWWGYRVSSVDVFGRHSDTGGDAAWRQWSPRPDPKPWYYVDPPSDAVIHAEAVRLLDRVPPPMPTAVEAFALDPADPTVLRDQRYADWLATLTAAERTSVVGLRVRWTWTEAHMRQAPDTHEFRLYYQAGTDPPTGRETATAWAQRMYVVGYDQHFTAGTDAAGRPLRRYEVIIPASGDAQRAGLPLAPSLADPVVYAHVGVSAADGRAHAPDAPKWNGTPFGGRPGNEGAVGPPAKIFRVLRQKPPAPTVPPDSERVWATPADWHGDSYYTYRWRPSPHLKTHVLRALDESVYAADWARRPRAALSASDAPAFPDPAAEPRWDAVKRQQVADELNALNAVPAAPRPPAQALAIYRALSNDALRVLAGLPGTEAAFTQITIQPLDPADAGHANRVGPDNPSTFAVDASLRAYVDRLDGRGTNRWFYRCLYVDGAHNRGSLSASGPPVWLPNVVPPRAPSVLRAQAGDRRVTVAWASNREADLAEYRVYRCEGTDDARDLRLMTLVHTLTVAAGDPAARPAELTWLDQPVPALTNFAYRVVAVDSAGNVSEASSTLVGRAYDESLPAPPTPTASWGAAAPFPARLTWTAADESLLERREATGLFWVQASGWLPAGAQTIDDAVADTAAWTYRVRSRKPTGAVAAGPTVTLSARTP